MSHQCSSALIRCMDFRLTDAINKWMEEKGIMNDCDVISFAGVSKAIADDVESSAAKFIIQQIQLSVKLHDTKTLYLINHTDCGAYGGHSAFSDSTTERQKHESDMIKARQIITQLIPELEVRLVLANISESGEIKVEEI